jgi:hypothetical protein
VLGRKAIVAAACAACLAAPPAAYADSDPASDILPVQDTFLPYQPRISPDLKAKLEGATKAAKQAGYPIKVAIIATPADLGGVPDLFNQPTKYAAFLGREITFNKKAQPLLVVMPVGLGTYQAGPRATSAIGGIRPEGGPDGLANAALEGVVKLSAAAGNPIEGFKPESSGGSGSTSAVVFAIPVALLVIALAVLSYRRAGREDEEEEARAAG